MRAAVRERYGPPRVVSVRDVPKPSPGPGQVLVRVMVAAVNRADIDGLLPKPSIVRLFTGLRAPRPAYRRVGLDVAGVVEAVGPGATRFRPGDRVFADLYQHGGGAFAEYVAAPADAFTPISDGIAFETAAALPHSAVLAVQGLRRRDGRTPTPGAKVLIDGASGNVGPFALQIAKALGAEVTGVASAEKLDFVRGLGADHVIDYRTADYTTLPERYDWILDVDSHHSVRAGRRALRRGGTYLTLGGSNGAILGALVVGSLLSLRSDRWSGLMLWWKPSHPPDLEAVARMVQAGEVRVAIDRTYPLERVVEALAWVHEGRARGKVLVTVAEE